MTENLLGAGIAHDDAAGGCFGEQDTHGDGLDDRPEVQLVGPQFVGCIIGVIGSAVAVSRFLDV